jgi:hypothetical protein
MRLGYKPKAATFCPLMASSPTTQHVGGELMEWRFLITKWLYFCALNGMLSAIGRVQMNTENL